MKEVGKKVDEGVRLAFRRLREKQATDQPQTPEPLDVPLLK